MLRRRKSPQRTATPTKTQTPSPRKKESSRWRLYRRNNSGTPDTEGSLVSPSSKRAPLFPARASPGSPASPGGMPASPGEMPAYLGRMPAPPGGMLAHPGGMSVSPGRISASPGGMPVSPGGIPAPPGGMPVDESDWGIRKLVKSLSLKDDPRVFGKGTIAARRMQREELDAVMARALFQREVMNSLHSDNARGLQQMASPVVNTSAERTAASQELPEQFILPLEDSLHSDNARGLPQEVSPVADTSTERMTASQELPEQLILPPELARVFHATHRPRTIPEPEVFPGPVSQGLTASEISSVLVKFSQQFNVTRVGSPQPRSRIRGRQALPKQCASTKEVMSDAEGTECAICLNDFIEGQQIGLLPCCHRFHVECAIDWLQRRSTCPECREELRPFLQ